MLTFIFQSIVKVILAPVSDCFVGNYNFVIEQVKLKIYA